MAVMCNVLFGANAPPKVISAAPATPIASLFPEFSEHIFGIIPFEFTGDDDCHFFPSGIIGGRSVASIARHLPDHMTDHLHDEFCFVMSCVANDYFIHRPSRPKQRLQRFGTHVLRQPKRTSDESRDAARSKYPISSGLRFPASAKMAP